MSKKAAEHISSPKNTIRMLRVTMVKQLSIMKADTTRKRPITRTSQGDTRFTLGIIPMQLPWLTWKNTVRNSR